MKNLRNIFIALATLLAIACSKEGPTPNGGGGNKPNPEETVYKMEWVSKIPDGQWIKGSKQFFDGMYISDTLKVKTIPEGGKPTWKIELIDGAGLPTFVYGKTPTGFTDYQAFCPTFGQGLLEGEGNTAVRWRVKVSINVGTPNEQTLTAEYNTLPRVRGRQFMYTDGENPITNNSYDHIPIKMKVGEVINIYTGKIPHDHTGQQYASGWDIWSIHPDILNNGIYEIIKPLPANKGQIKAIGVGKIFASCGRDIEVTE